MIKVILWDLDNTILNFSAAEHNALKDTFEYFNLVECSDDMIKNYSQINHRYWKKLELNEIAKPRMLVQRFEEFFALEKIEFDEYEEFNYQYQIRLGNTIVFNDNAYELIREFKQEYKQYIVTNGTALAQKNKLINSNLLNIIDDVFISEKIGYEKPHIEFFNHVFDNIGNYTKEEIIIVGDSLTGDIQGANNAMIKCCWYNPLCLEKPQDLRIDYMIDDLNQLVDILN